MLKALFRAWRIVATGGSFVLFGMGAAIIGLLTSLIIYPLPLKRAKKQVFVRRCISGGCWFYVRCLRFIGLLSFQFENLSRLRNANGRLIIANHPGLLDAVFLLSVLPQTNCIVKAGLFRNPFTFGAVSLAGYLRNDSDELLVEASERIQQGQSLVVFPEGTRSQGAELKFQRGAANIAVLAACPIQAVLIDCKPPTLQKHQAWYEVPATPPVFKLSIDEPFELQSCIDTSRPRSIQARHLTRYLLAYYREHIR